jgi:hypothetical protein
LHAAALNSRSSPICSEPTRGGGQYLHTSRSSTLLSAWKFYDFGFGTQLALNPGTMAEKQSSKDAVKQLLEGRLDPNTRLAKDLTDAVAERVLKNAVPDNASQRS